MNRKQVHLEALRLAYGALQKAVECGPSETDRQFSYEDQNKIDDALDAIAQSFFERLQRAEDRAKR